MTVVRVSNQVYGWLLFFPAAVMFFLFTHYPILATLKASFFSTPRGARPARFVGLENYRVMFDDPVFWKVLGNNFIFAAGTIPLSIGLALLMAVWVNGKLSGRSIVRTAYFTPTVLPMIAVANIWLFFYTPQIGLLDGLTGLLGFPSRNWLGEPSTVMSCLIVMTIWKEAGFFMIFYLAALQSISPELQDAGRIEGAGRWYFFRRVTWPLLMPTTVFILFNAVINAFKLVDHLFIMTKGGPNNASSLLLYYIYEVAFSFWDTAYASTLTMALLAVLAVLALSQFVYLERRTHYQ
ncbi:carbohydrate ABC transporter permease [Desulfonatronum lacustre]|uniref:carbohydrate ABC transporter permease n=1 Tax=Desulfonatronum lacustre TaxID=66849 RepID=UPI0004B2A41E|nr:sugar ABC transporter permease [Desulfonatronum lacustre]